jgi:hypothetical protein
MIAGPGFSHLGTQQALRRPLRLDWRLGTISFNNGCQFEPFKGAAGFSLLLGLLPHANFKPSCESLAWRIWIRSNAL